MLLINVGLEQLEQMNAEGGGTNQPIMKGGTTYAKGGGSIDVKGREIQENDNERCRWKKSRIILIM